MKSNFAICLLILFLGCITSNDNQEKESQASEHGKPLPPLMPPEEHRKCDSLKSLAYINLSKGEITIAFNDTIRNNTVLYGQFVTILNARFGFNYFRLYDVGFETVAYKQCVLPIMDSAIAAKYGKNAKDSFINLVYRMADTAYKMNKRSN